MQDIKLNEHNIELINLSEKDLEELQKIIEKLGNIDSTEDVIIPGAVMMRVPKVLNDGVLEDAEPIQVSATEFFNELNEAMKSGEIPKDTKEFLEDSGYIFSSTKVLKDARKMLDDTYAVMFSNPEYSKYLFYAHILGQCTVRLDPNLPASAAVSFVRDHFELYIHPIQFARFPVQQRIGVLKHEAEHIIEGHLGDRGKGLHHKIANLAMDCAINQHIDRKHLPAGVIYPDTLKKYLEQFPENNGKNIKVPEKQSFEIYYRLIVDNLPQSEKDRLNQEGQGGGESQDCPDCNGTGEQNDSKCESCNGTGKEKPKFVPQEPTTFDDHSKFGEGDVSEDFIKERIKGMLEKAKDATLMSNGFLPSNYSDLIDLYTVKQSDVPWQKLFQNVASNTKFSTRETFMRRSRRFRGRPDVKGKLPNRTFNWLGILDVSGSMPQHSVQAAVQELNYLSKKMNVQGRLIQVDVQPYESIPIDGNLKKFERLANGGTEMYPGIEQAKKENLEYDAVVIMTDGGLGEYDIEHFLDVKVPVIWIITEDYNEPLERFERGRMKAARLKTDELRFGQSSE